jgi:CBS domain-containing protein
MAFTVWTFPLDSLYYESNVRLTGDKPMKLRDILRRKGTNVLTIRHNASLQDAVESLAANNIGVLLVMDDTDRPMGIISERDIVQQLARTDGSLAGLRVSDAMTRELVIGVPDDTVDYAMQVMTQQRIRHLPVMDGDTLAGLVSIGDLVKAHINQTETEIRYLHSYIQGTRT